MTDARLRNAGDAALIIEFAATIAPEVNARAIAVARRLRASLLPGVRDVVPTYRSVAVHIDPFVAEVGAIGRAVSQILDRTGDAEDADSSPDRSRLIEIPVTYGGDAGPDLDDVAVFAGLSRDEVIARHAGREYRVYMLGFMPGFAYMGSVDPAIAAPRRATPRVRVPAGSVGIAGEQTGVYPVESPGGWQIIGSTTRRMFDARASDPALCAPGDRVRFVPRHAARATDDEGPNAAPSFEDPPGAVTAVTVLRPGLFTTVQDDGRWGHQALGVPVAGALDPIAHLQANALVGNRPDAATLEVTMAGPELRFERTCAIAIAGADLSPTLDGSPVPHRTAVRGAAGSVLRFGARRAGARASIAIAGGWDVAPVLGSRATHVRSGMGGMGGRPLRAGDQLPVGPAGTVAADAPAFGAPRLPQPSSGSQGAAGAEPLVLRVIAGPHDEWFPEAAFDLLTASVFTIDPQSDRMGFRLAGGSALPRAPGEMISDATVAGGLQVPASGHPILLMADRQTTGGYPIIAVVITADLPAAGQLLPGDQVRFRLCSQADARAALARDPRGRA